ncbi:unnamed protein product [Leuciscus chuanchicus]
MSSRSLAQLAPLVVAPATNIMLESTTLDGVCLAQAKKALAVCFNYPHAGSPHWAPYVKAGPHPSPCQTGNSPLQLGKQDRFLSWARRVRVLKHMSGLLREIGTMCSVCAAPVRQQDTGLFFFLDPSAGTEGSGKKLR